MKPTLVDSTIIYIITKLPRIRFILDQGIGEAYDHGYKQGLYEGSKVHGKKYANKVKRAIRKQYNKDKVGIS